MAQGAQQPRTRPAVFGLFEQWRQVSGALQVGPPVTSPADCSPPSTVPRAGYERVQGSDDRRPGSKFDQRYEWYMKKFWAAVWVGAALSVANVVDMWHVVTEDFVTGRPQHRLHRCARARCPHRDAAAPSSPARQAAPGARRGYFKLGIVCFALWTVVAAYLVVWVKYILKVQEEWEDYAPKSIPIATGIGFVGIVSCARRSARPRGLPVPATTRSPRCLAPCVAALAQVHRVVLADLGLPLAAHRLRPLHGHAPPRALCAALIVPALDATRHTAPAALNYILTYRSTWPTGIA